MKQSGSVQEMTGTFLLVSFHFYTVLANEEVNAETRLLKESKKVSSKL